MNNNFSYIHFYTPEMHLLFFITTLISIIHSHKTFFNIYHFSKNIFSSFDIRINGVTFFIHPVFLQAKHSSNFVSDYSNKRCISDFVSKHTNKSHCFKCISCIESQRRISIMYEHWSQMQLICDKINMFFCNISTHLNEYSGDKFLFETQVL